MSSFWSAFDWFKNEEIVWISKKIVIKRNFVTQRFYQTHASNYKKNKLKLQEYHDSQILIITYKKLLFINENVGKWKAKKKKQFSLELI